MQASRRISSSSSESDGPLDLLSSAVAVAGEATRAGDSDGVSNRLAAFRGSDLAADWDSGVGAGLLGVESA